jgi:hypothetical protein
MGSTPDEKRKKYIEARNQKIADEKEKLEKNIVLLKKTIHALQKLDYTYSGITTNYDVITYTEQHKDDEDEDEVNPEKSDEEADEEEELNEILEKPDEDKELEGDYKKGVSSANFTKSVKISNPVATGYAPFDVFIRYPNKLDIGNVLYTNIAETNKMPIRNAADTFIKNILEEPEKEKEEPEKSTSNGGKNKKSRKNKNKKTKRVKS